MFDFVPKSSTCCSKLYLKMRGLRNVSGPEFRFDGAPGCRALASAKLLLLLTIMLGRQAVCRIVIVVWRESKGLQQSRRFESFFDFKQSILDTQAVQPREA